MAGKELPKIYDSKSVEDSTYHAWETSGFFNPDNLPASTRSSNRGEPGRRKDAFTIAMPPPNATGILHVGHAVMLALQDIVIRFQRMRGKKALWLPGTDHAAIATQAKVEKNIFEQERKTRHDLGRDELLKRIDAFVEQSRSTIQNQVRKMGSSCDWSRERFTLDEGLSQAVAQAFTEMYHDGLIYRGDRIVNWCPNCGSTLADDEVEYKEERAPFYYFKYGPVIIGTARPETKFGDKIIIVHPDDPRYKDLVGKEMDVEWILGSIKAQVIADTAADMTLGSGAMTITPGHSFVDFELAKKYDIPVEKIIDEKGNLTEAAGSFVGLPVREARQKVVELLQQKGLVDHIDENYVHNLSVCYRCGTPIEPLVSKQWFVNVNKSVKKFKGKTIKERALEVVRGGDIKIIPDRFEKTYYHWMENLRDWCISRQIWYGHRIPVWYCGNQEMKRMGFAGDIVKQVFDGKISTWRLRDHGFSAGDVVAFEDSTTKRVFGYGIMVAVGQTTVGAIDLNDRKHYATYKNHDELIAAFKRHNPHKEVTLSTPVWVYEYTFDKNLKIEGCGSVIASVEPLMSCPACGGKNLRQDPDTLDTWFSSGLWTFSTLGWPSKSKDLKTFHPTDLMETGYDIIFFWVARMIIMSTYFVEEVPFKTVYLHGLVRDEHGVKMSKSLGNVIDPLDTIAKYGADATRLSLVIGTTPGNDMNMSEAKIAGYRNFVNKLWNISRYILMTVEKPRIVEKAPKAQTLADEWILSELHELITFATDNLERYNFSVVGEKIYEFTWNKLADWYVEVAKIEKNKDEVLCYVLTQLLKLWHPFTPFVTEEIWKELGGKDFIMIASWPAVKGKSNITVSQEFSVIRDIVTAIRNVRSESNIAPAHKLRAVIISSSHKKNIKREQIIIKSLARLESLELSSRGKAPAGSLSAVLPGIEIYLPVSGMIDVGREAARLRVEARQIREFVDHLEQKLQNARFIERAPAEIIETEKQKLGSNRERLEKIEQQLKTLES